MRVLWSLLAVTCLTAGGLYVVWPDAPRSFDAVRGEYRSSYSVILDRHGEVVQELRVDHESRRLDWTSLEDVSPAVLRAVVEGEDRDFWEHHGLDWGAMIRAVAGNMLGRSVRGASTISMQLVSLLDPGLQPRAGRRTVSQKFMQALTAMALERSWTKEQILESYLNLVTYRSESTGICAASWGLFRVAPAGLGDDEACILASLIRSPNASVREVARRAVDLSRRVGRWTDAVTLEGLTHTALAMPFGLRPSVNLAPLAGRRLAGPSVVHSTLDARMQRMASDLLRKAILGLWERRVHDGAVLVVDNVSGDVLAYVGNAGDAASAVEVDGVQARRQTGSSLKPFLYALAFERRLLTPASLLDDSPLNMQTPRGIYNPSNYDKAFHGLVTARTALASSLNVPAVRTLDLVGVDRVVELLGRLGLTGLRDGAHYGSSLALGTVDTSLWELVNAYRTMASGGGHGDLSLLPRDSSPRHQVLSAPACFLVADILSDREARSLSFGLDNPLATRFWSAVKTGTSKDMRDNWCVGFSSRYTVGVWVGNFSGQPMWDVSGVTGAAPVWREIMNSLHRDDPGTIVRPEGVVSREVFFAHTGLTRRECFLAGTETDRVEAAWENHMAEIVYPPDQALLALDPDKNARVQKVFFRATNGAGDERIVLDGADLGSLATHDGWIPVRGRHELLLCDGSGQTVDRIRFTVR